MSKQKFFTQDEVNKIVQERLARQAAVFGKRSGAEVRAAAVNYDDRQRRLDDFFDRARAWLDVDDTKTDYNSRGAFSLANDRIKAGNWLLSEASRLGNEVRADDAEARAIQADVKLEEFWNVISGRLDDLHTLWAASYNHSAEERAHVIELAKHNAKIDRLYAAIKQLEQGLKVDDKDIDSMIARSFQS